MRRLLFIPLLAFLAAPAFAEQTVPPITNPAVAKECGACHMPFPPQFLPRRSWRKIMDGLADHFGEDASLPEPQRQAILDYLLANAGDAAQSGEAGKFARGIPADATPLRITETPRWLREHRGLAAGTWSNPKIKSRSNCLACHKAAARGIFEDD
jgi:cytochrome c551/c552